MQQTYQKRITTVVQKFQADLIGLRNQVVADALNQQIATALEA